MDRSASTSWTNRSTKWLFSHGEALLFWAMAGAHLVPIWSFRYLPTQDGPAHVDNALILKDYSKTAARYQEFFEVRLDATPNWTSHLMMAGLMFLVPPLIAEKVLVSIYVIGLAGSLRYWCSSFGPQTRPLALVGLLFVYNRCLWLGFYNFVLSLALCWFVLGYWLRRRESANLGTAAALTTLLAATLLTHLVGYLIAALALVWLAATSPKHRLRNLGLAVLACLPAALLAMDYFDRTGFFSAGGSSRLRDHAWQWLCGQGSWSRVGDELLALDGEFFAHHIQGAMPMGLIAVAMFLGLALATILPAIPWFSTEAIPIDGDGKSSAAESSLASPWPALVLVAVLVALYILLPLHLNLEHGGFLKGRIALAVPLVFLACLSEPPQRVVRLVLRLSVTIVILANLVFVTRRIAADNRELAEYTAGLDAAGAGHVLFVMQELQRSGRHPGRELADPLLHASHYYSLGTNLNLDNYEATTRHFPLRFRDGITRGRGVLAFYEQQQDVDLVLAWEARSNPRLPPSFQSVFRHGGLEIFEKKAP